MFSSIRSFTILSLCCLLLCQSHVLAGQAVITTPQECFQPEIRIKTSAWLKGIYFSPDGRLVTQRGRKRLKVWDVDAGQLKATLTLPDLEDVIFSELAFSPDGKTLAAVLASKAGLWDTQTWELRAKLIGPGEDNLKYETCGCGSSVSDMIFSPDGRLLATLDYRLGTVILWDGHTGERKAILHEGIRSIAFSPDAKLLALGGYRKAVRIFDLNAGKVVRTFRAERDEIASVNFSPDGRLLVGSDGKESYVWEMASGQLKQKLSKATQATFNPDGRTLATVYEDQLTLWDVSCR